MLKNDDLVNRVFWKIIKVEDVIYGVYGMVWVVFIKVLNNVKLFGVFMLNNLIFDIYWGINVFKFSY